MAGLLLSCGRFGAGALVMSIAFLGDAIDGRVARRSGTASVGGALLDASADRYGEFFCLAGLAVYFRESTGALVLALCALSGSFMISYGSAKAEGLGVSAPSSAMRRAERAVCLCAGVALAAAAEWLTPRLQLPAWAAHAPVFVALWVLAVVANTSAILRLRALARVSSPVPPPPAGPAVGAPEPSVVPASHALRIR
jgi:phosphatidylglycerophosphate synthase